MYCPDSNWNYARSGRARDEKLAEQVFVVKVGDSAALEQVKAIALQTLRAYSVKVLLFGSWARGTQHRNSDIDIAILPHQPLPRGLLATLREQLEEGTIPCRVDVVDLSIASPEFRERIFREGIVWTDS